MGNKTRQGEQHLQAQARPFKSARLGPDAIASWGDVVAPILIDLGDFTCNFETVSWREKMPTSGPFLLAHGVVGNGQFALALRVDFVKTILSQVDPDLKQLPSDPMDMALIVEWIFAKMISAAEGTYGSEAKIISAEQCSQLPDYHFLCLESINAVKGERIALALDEELALVANDIVGRFTNRSERGISNVLNVKIGPTLISSKPLRAAKRGDIIDFGINPDQDVHGILEREDGRFWPIHVEDSSVRILGDLQEPLGVSRQVGTTLTTLRVGRVFLHHYQRVQLAKGWTVSMDRISDNGAFVSVGKDDIAAGVLDVRDNSLCIHVTDGAQPQ